MADITKSPRVFIDTPLSEGIPLRLPEPALHYLRNVMRIAPGAAIRVFDGRHGEFVARMERLEKRHGEITVENRIREQPGVTRRIHLLVPPLKKERFDLVIEKAAELGATDIYPVLTQNTDVRKINDERIRAQIIEACEQCERLDIPSLHLPENLFAVLGRWSQDVPVYAALERMGTEVIPRGESSDAALLVGPAGGFTAEEKCDLVGLPFVHPVGLGHTILRSETAVIAGLSLLVL